MKSAQSRADTAPTRYAWEIQATGLKARVGGKRMAVDGLGLSLDIGVHGLLGPNGAGKTTLIRTLATVVRPVEGTLKLLGESAGAMGGRRGLRRRIGYLPQEFGYYKPSTVREFVEYMAWLKEVPKAEIPAAVQRAVERVGLADRADKRMRTLSGGRVRRVGIAQAIVSDPTILLLDEPTAGLDQAERLRVRQLLREMRADTCVLVSTQLVEDVAAACTDVVLLAEGRLVFRGTPYELAAAESLEQVGDSPLKRGHLSLTQGGKQGGSW